MASNSSGSKSGGRRRSGTSAESADRGSSSSRYWSRNSSGASHRRPSKPVCSQRQNGSRTIASSPIAAVKKRAQCVSSTVAARRSSSIPSGGWTTSRRAKPPAAGWSASHGSSVSSGGDVTRVGQLPSQSRLETSGLGLLSQGVPTLPKRAIKALRLGRIDDWPIEQKRVGGQRIEIRRLYPSISVGPPKNRYGADRPPAQRHSAAVDRSWIAHGRLVIQGGQAHFSAETSIAIPAAAGPKNEPDPDETTIIPPQRALRHACGFARHIIRAHARTSQLANEKTSIHARQTPLDSQAAVFRNLGAVTSAV